MHLTTLKINEGLPVIGLKGYALVMDLR